MEQFIVKLCKDCANFSGDNANGVPICNYGEIDFINGGRYPMDAGFWRQDEAPGLQKNSCGFDARYFKPKEGVPLDGPPDVVSVRDDRGAYESIENRHKAEMEQIKNRRPYFEQI